MALQDTMNILNELASALQSGSASLRAYDDLAKRYKAREEEIKVLKEKEKDLRITIKNYVLLINAYRDAYGNVFKICPDCNGEGGHYFEAGPGEGGHFPCDHCQAKGIIS